MDRIMWENTFSGNFEDREYAIEVFNRHNEGVKEHVPVDRLLVYEVKDGWEPMCVFLEVGVPEGKPFPHLNDTAAFVRMVQQRVAVVSAVLIGGTLLAGLALLYFFAPRRTRGGS
jgi:Sulfotransferase domain